MLLPPFLERGFDMRKKAIGALVTAFTVALSSVSALGGGISVNGSDVKYTVNDGVPYVDENGRTQVPLRKTMEAAGCRVSWVDDTKTAVVEKNGVKVEAPIGKKYIRRNGVRIENDTAAVIKDGRTYLPIRAVLEAFGFTVKWDSVTGSVAVITLNETAEVHFIDVGQGDCIFVDIGETEVIIDAGEKENGAKVSGYIKPYVDGKLDYLVATHAHSDHIGGLARIIDDYDIGTVITGGETATSKVWQSFVGACEKGKCRVIEDSDMVIDLGSGCSMQVIEAIDGDKNPNNNSVVCLFDLNGTLLLLTGDCEKKAETIIAGKVGEVDVFKAGHHGSSTSNSVELLKAVTPEYVIVEAGLNNSYGHPEESVLKRFNDMGIIAYGTFKSGTIVLTADKDGYSFNTDDRLTLADAGAKEGGYNIDPADEPNTATEYTGNANSKVYHRASCRYAEKTAEENRVYMTKAEFEAAGYTACKQCKP